MRAKPSGPKYRNLYTSRGSIWYERVAAGRRFRANTETPYNGKSPTRAQWDEAAAFRDRYEEKRGIGRLQYSGEVPVFAVAAREALEVLDARRAADSEASYAASTTRDLHRVLREDGPIVPRLGQARLDRIEASTLRRWHDAEIVARGLTFKTGDNLLDAIEMVFRFARGRGDLDRSHRPVTDLREELRQEQRTKRARSVRDTRRRLARDGVLRPEEVGRLAAAARIQGLEPLVIVLLPVESGLRRGEISGLRWGDVAWGEGDDDATRALEIHQARSRGGPPEAPKSGQGRRPHISQRLRQALRELYRARWEPGPEVRVVRTHYFDLDKVVLRRVLERAGLPHRTFQNLRATCSSLLKQWGVAPAYVRAVIGHENEAVARKHYDRLDFTDYRAPERVEPGETPMDLFARLCPEPIQTPHTFPTVAKKASQRRRVGWRPQRDSNPCCRLERAES